MKLQPAEPAIANDNRDAALAFYDKRQKWIDYVLTVEALSDRGCRVGIWLARRMNGSDQCCWYSIPKIAQMMGKKPRTIANAIEDLRAANVMLVVEKRGKPNRYFLHAPFF